MDKSSTPQMESSSTTQFGKSSMAQSWSLAGLCVGSAYSGSGEVVGFSTRDRTNQFILGRDTPSPYANWSYYKRGWRSGAKRLVEPVWCDLDHVPPSRIDALGLMDPDKAIWSGKQILRKREAELEAEEERRQAILAHRAQLRARLGSRHAARHVAQLALGQSPPPAHDYGARLHYVSRGGLQPYVSQGAPPASAARLTGSSSSLSSANLSMARLEAWHAAEPERPPSQMRKTAPELHCEGLRDLPGLPRHPIIVGPAYDAAMETPRDSSASSAAASRRGAR